MEGIFDCDKTKVLECNGCGMQFLDKIMTEKEESDFYYNYYNRQDDRQYKDMSLKDFQDRAVLQYEDYFRDVYLNLVKDSKDILEVGSGSGGFLQFILKYFKDKNISSAERSQQNFDFLTKNCKEKFKDITFYRDSNEIKDKKFDLITAFGVFEHVRHSKAFLQDLKPLLKDSNSKLIMTFPNKYNPFVYLHELEEFKKFLYMKMHYYTFSTKSLEILAEETGYNIENIYYWQVWGLDNAFSWLKNRKPSDFCKYTNFFSKEINDMYKKELTQNKMTDTMILVLNKK